MNKFTLGADPEVFMKDAQDSFFSAIGVVGGSKHHPRLLLELGDGFAVQEDNVAVEYNIPPAATVEQFQNYIQRAMSYLSDMVAQNGLKFVNVSATNEFPEWQLQDPRAQEFGCDPDFNAWENGRRNPRPKASDQSLRSCGGHVHVGYKFKAKKDVIKFIKYLDLFLLVPAQLMDNGKLRMELYGKPGAFRFKPYGTEYRSLSNFWIFDSKYQKWVWDSVDRAVHAFENDEILIDQERDMIMDAIMNSNKHAVDSLVYRHNLLVV